MLSDLFYTIDFSISIFIASISSVFGFLIISIFILNRQYHNNLNLLTCNTAMAVILYFIFNLISSIYSIQNNWFSHQPACAFRAYGLGVACVAICYSYAIQAISRLFYAVFYKHKWLLTQRTHYFLILINWLISLTLPTVPILIGGGYILEEESRFCVATTKVFSASMYSIVAGFFIPFSTTIIIYAIILYKAHQSTRRIVPFVPTTVINNPYHHVPPVPNMKRELKVMKNILILINILAFGGMPYFILVIWNVTANKPPEPFYLLIINCVSMAASLTVIATFLMCKKLRQYATAYLC